MSAPPEQPPQLESSWLARNWKWFAPVLALLCAGCIAGTFAIMFSVMRASDPYKIALQEARASDAAVRALGTPLTDGFFVLGNIHLTSSAGQAQFEIPVHGPAGQGRIYVEASRTRGVWSFGNLTLVVDGTGQRIDLLEASAKK